MNDRKLSGTYPEPNWDKILGQAVKDPHNEIIRKLNSIEKQVREIRTEVRLWREEKEAAK